MEVEVEKQLVGKKVITEGFTFDDVLLVPQRSSVVSRMDVDFATKLTRNIELKIPLVSANMSSVTESAMAIAMAQQGGVGIIHRNLSIEREAEEVRRVKRSENTIIERPFSVKATDTIERALAEAERHGVSGLVVVDDNGKLVGILTHRDLMFETGGKLVGEVMTKDPVVARWGTAIEELLELMRVNKVEKVPLVDENGFLKGLITARDVLKKRNYPNAVRDARGRLRVGASVGIRGDHKERAEAVLAAEADVIAVDVAHGHMERVLEIVKWLKTSYGCEVIAGNVATRQGCRDLIEAGADAVKVGVGPGCFAAGTRILMANGIYKNIENVNAGDKLINKNGKPVTVAKAFSTGIREVSRMRNSIFYDYTYVTPDHRYWVGDLNTNSIETIHSRGYVSLLQQQSKTIPKQTKFKWKEVKELKQDVLLMPAKIDFELSNHFEIPLKKRKGGKWKNSQTYEIDVVLKPSYELGYIFGTFLGDGTAHTAALNNGSHIGSVRWYFGKNEGEIAEKLQKCIGIAFGEKYNTKIIEKINMTQVMLYYKPFADFLSKWSKKDRKHLPAEYLIKNEAYLRGILDGLVDSDGYTEAGGRIRFTNTSKQLIELFNVASYLISGVFPNNLRKGISAGGLVNCNVNKCKESYVAEIINTGSKRLTQEYQVSKILEKEQTNQSVEVFDLEIDCPTHSFIANNAIVHNSICTTRIVAGTGYPQLSAVLNCAEEGHRNEVPIIADGGMKAPGDFVKAIAAGASTGMFGQMFAGTDESPGKMVFRNGKRFKMYHGMASWTALQGLKESDRTPEGVESMVGYKGSIKEVVSNLLGGLRSGMSYSNAHTIPELWKNAEFVKITNASLRESHSHDVDVI